MVNSGIKHAFKYEKKTLTEFSMAIDSACTNGRFGRIYIRKFLSYAKNRHQRLPRSSKIVTVYAQLQKACRICQSVSE